MGKPTLKFALGILIVLTLISLTSALTITENFNSNSNLQTSTARIVDGKALSKPLSPVINLINSFEGPIVVPYNLEFDENNDHIVDLNDLKILGNKFTQITARLESSKNDVSYK